MSDRPFRVPVVLVVISLAAMALFFVAFDRDWFPLGIPGEWIWATPDVWAEATSPWISFLPAGIALVMLTGWAVWAAPRVEIWSRGRFFAAIAGCMVLGAIFQFFCEVAAPSGLQKWAALHSNSANGFHAAAVYHSTDLSTFFTDHAGAIRDFQPHHYSANPPGWVLVYGGLFNFFADHPQLAQRIWKWGPDELPWRLRRTNGVKAVPLNQQAALVTIAFTSRLICFLGVIPAAWVTAMRYGRQASLAAASAVLLLPVEPLFAPSRDTIYPTIALLVLALSHYAWDRRSWLVAAVAGVVLGVGTFFSVTFFTIGGLAALYVAAQSIRGKRPTLAAVCAAPLAWLAVVGLIHLAGHNSWATWSINLGKNGEFNQLYRQSYGAWTIVNLLEFGAAVGLPLVIFLAGRVTVVRRADPLLCAWAAMLLLLDVAGTNRGEACRLWLFMMPIAALLSVEWLPRLGGAFRFSLAAFLALQALNCVILDRDLVLYTDLELSQARRESGLWKLRMTERGFGSPGIPAAQLLEPSADTSAENPSHNAP
jgi:hypothetical protein